MMHLKCSRRSVLGGLALGTLLPPGLAHAAAPGVTADEVVLGMWTPLTGATALLGTSERDAIEYAIAEVNAAGGVNGRRIRLIVYDDAGSPQDALAAVRRLVDQDGVFALIAGSISGSTLPVLPLINRARVPFIASISSNDALITPASPTVFRVYANESVQAGNLVDYAIGTGIKRPAILYTSNDYGIGGEKVVREHTARAQRTLVTTERYNQGDQDFSAQLLRIKQSGADSLFVWAFAAEAGIIVRQAKDLGLSLPLFGGGGTGTPLFLRSAGEAGIGFTASYVCPHLPETSDVPVIVAYREALSKRYGGKLPPGRPSEYDLAGYGALKIFTEALRVAGSTPTREGLVSALETLKQFAPGMIFPVTFGPGRREGCDRSSIIKVNPAVRWEVVT